MKIIQAQFMVNEETLMELAVELRALCESHLVDGAEVVVYNMEANPTIDDMIYGAVRWEDRTIQ